MLRPFGRRERAQRGQAEIEQRQAHARVQRRDLRRECVSPRGQVWVQRCAGQLRAACARLVIQHEGVEQRDGAGRMTRGFAQRDREGAGQFHRITDIHRLADLLHHAACGNPERWRWSASPAEASRANDGGYEVSRAVILRRVFLRDRREHAIEAGINAPDAFLQRRMRGHESEP